MAKSVEALINPDVLAWARKTARFEVADVCAKLDIDEGRLEDWESGRDRPSIAKLRDLANLYKRPLAFFYLPEPPKKFKALHDYRRLAGAEPGAQSPRLALEIRLAHARREVAIDTAVALGDLPPAPDIELSLTDDPDSAAEKLRAFLGVTLETQFAWKTSRDAYREWRAAFERQAILVFQTSGVPLDEVRGFSSADEAFPFVVVNGKDSPTGRIFTMFHELAHVALRRPGLCDLHQSERGTADDRLEVFCNQIAGAALVPSAALVSQPIVGKRSGSWDDRDLRTLARRFGVSREVILRRLLTLGRTTQAFYARTREKLLQEYAEMKSGGGPVAQHELALARHGDRFVRLVMTAWHSDYLTLRDVSDYLNLRVKHLDPLEKELRIRRAS